MQDFLNPEQVLKQLKLQEEMNAADFGSGSGGWAIPLAKKLEGGKVYAVDLLEEPLSALRAKINLGRITNIQIIRADVEKGVNIFEESLDLVLMTNLLFEVEDIKKVLQEGKRLLKRGGKILVVDWKKDAPLGPKGKRISVEEIKKTAKDLNLKSEKEFSAGTYHFGLVLVK